MKFSINLIFVFYFTFSSLLANDYTILSFDDHPIQGTLVESNEDSLFLAIIIAGSGPTDRDGNNSSMTSNYLKMLADELNKNGINSFRYDKRGVSKSLGDIKSPNEIKFSDYVNDAKSIINHGIPFSRWLEYIVKCCLGISTRVLDTFILNARVGDYN